MSTDTPNTAASAEREAIARTIYDFLSERFPNGALPGGCQLFADPGDHVDAEMKHEAGCFALADAILALTAPPVEAGGVEPDDEMIERGLRVIRAYDAVRWLRDAMSATSMRLTGYDWNADPDGVTKQMGDAFSAADKVFADLERAVDTHPPHDADLEAHPAPDPAGLVEADRLLDAAADHLEACYGTSRGLRHPHDRAKILTAAQGQGGVK